MITKKKKKRAKAIVPKIVKQLEISEEDKKAIEIVRTAIVAQKEVENMPMTNDQIELIKSQYAKGATDNELRLFLAICSRTGLDPFRKQIYFIKRRNYDSKAKEYVEVGSAQTSIDGQRSIAERTGKYAGNDDPIFDDEATPTKATVTVYKMVEGQRVPFTATARKSQYMPVDKDGNPIGPMWKKMPHLMLGKCAEALALRKAFPSAMAGVYITEEMQQASVPSAEETKMLEIEDAFAKLKSQIEKMTEKELKQYNNMLQKSDKYSDEQKTEFSQLVEHRLQDIKEIKKC